jgi:hypothetical protein
MAEQTNQPDSQKQRWLKYGGNVAVASIVVIALAVLVIYLAQSSRQRIDTTAAGQYSLKPQTKQIVADVKQPVRLISLYSAPTSDDYNARSGTESDADRRSRAERAADRQLRYDAVRDLLQEYSRAGGNIKAEMIDPLADPAEVDALVADLTDKYGGEVQRYRQFIATYREKSFPEIRRLAAEEAAAIGQVELPAESSDEQLQAIDAAKFTVTQFPRALERINALIEPPLQEKPPNYKGAVDAIRSGTEQFDGYLGQIITAFNEAKPNATLPANVRAYVEQAVPRYEAIRKLTTAVLDEVKGLGELKLDTLRQSLRARDSILVLGESDMRVLTAEQVWQAPTDRRAIGSATQVVRPQFAGEQQVTSAILSLTQKPRKVAFVRPGGPPIADPGMPPFQRGGPFSAVADRLRAYNFEVVEKDLSGMYAMQAQAQGMPPEPEPTDDELKDAIWIVLNFPTGRSPMGMPPTTIGPKVSEHLSRGGSALILNTLQADGLAEALADWGVTVNTQQVLVHEPVPGGQGQASDPIEEAKKVPPVFVLNEYGDHLLTRPLRSLDSIVVPLVPVTIQSKEGVTATPIVPIPNEPPAWAETDLQSLMSGESAVPTFDPASGDGGQPLFGGAVLDRAGQGRLVVLGGLQFASNDWVNMIDPALAQRNIVAARFPANAELVTNSVFWLARMEPMIAISPAAMEVSRIGPISPAALRFWRVGVLLVGLPLLVILAGVGVYVRRRD